MNKIETDPEIQGADYFVTTILYFSIPSSFHPTSPSPLPSHLKIGSWRPGLKRAPRTRQNSRGHLNVASTLQTSTRGTAGKSLEPVSDLLATGTPRRTQAKCLPSHPTLSAGT